MNKWLMCAISAILLLFSILMVCDRNQMLQSTEGTLADQHNNAAESNDVQEPDGSTIQTEVNGYSDEYPGSGEEAMDFHDQYTIEDPPMSGNWRISVIVDAVEDYYDMLHSSDCVIDIRTSEDMPVNRFSRLLYLPKSDTVVTRVGRIYNTGDNAANFYMYDNDYVFTVNMELVSIKVQYISQRYANNTITEKELYFNLENASSVRLEVSNFLSKEVHCFVIGPEGETEVFPSELPR